MARAGIAFRHATPKLMVSRELVVPRWLCLVGKGACATFQTKQKLKRHLLKKHNFSSVEEGRPGRPKSNPNRPSRTTQDQNKRYNDKARSNPLSAEAIRLAKTRRRLEITAAVAWEEKRDELKNFKVARTPPSG